MDHILFICSSISGHLSCFLAAVNMQAQISLHVPAVDFGTLLLSNFHGPSILVSGTHLPYCKGRGGQMMVPECRAHWTPGRVGDAGGRRGQEVESWGSGEPIPSCTDWTRHVESVLGLLGGVR